MLVFVCVAEEYGFGRSALPRMLSDGKQMGLTLNITQDAKGPADSPQMTPVCRITIGKCWWD